MLKYLLCLLLQCLVAMTDLRETIHFAYKVEMDSAIGKAVKSMGPQIVLDAVPLNLTGTEYVKPSSSVDVELICVHLNKSFY